MIVDYCNVYYLTIVHFIANKTKKIDNQQSETPTNQMDFTLY